MKDYTSYMLAEMLTGTFKAYGSAYGHGVSGVTMGAKTGTSTYGTEINQQYNLPDNLFAKDVWINGFTPKYTMSIWMGFSEIKEGGVNSFLGHSEQEYPQYLYEDVMSDITSSDDGDFKKPDSVNGSSADNLSVSGHPDNNTTNREVNGSSGSSSSNSSNNSNNSSNSNTSNTNNSGNTNSGTTNNNSTTQGTNTVGSTLSNIFNLNSIFDFKKSS